MVEGTDFFYQLQDDQEKIIESTIDLSKGSWSATKSHSSKDGESSSRTPSVRCSAITKKGTQCSRMTYSPNGKCWQHGGD